MSVLTVRPSLSRNSQLCAGKNPGLADDTVSNDGTVNGVHRRQPSKAWQGSRTGQGSPRQPLSACDSLVVSAKGGHVLGAAPRFSHHPQHPKDFPVTVPTDSNIQHLQVPPSCCHNVARSTHGLQWGNLRRLRVDLDSSLAFRILSPFSSLRGCGPEEPRVVPAGAARSGRRRLPGSSIGNWQNGRWHWQQDRTSLCLKTLASLSWLHWQGRRSRSIPFEVKYSVCSNLMSRNYHTVYHR